MRTAWLAGILIAVCCGLLQLIFGFTDWYKNPVWSNRFWDLFSLIQLLCLIFGLFRTAKEGKRYREQVLSGTIMSLIAGMILFSLVILFGTVFPHYAEAMATLQRRALESTGITPGPVGSNLVFAAQTAVPVVQGGYTLLGTTVMGFLYSLIVSAVVRKGIGEKR
jgi:hypothetical protein